jgi:RNA polymerase sigma factor (sigma-70 family)
MRLTDEQRRLASEAVGIVPAAIAAFRMRYPTLRKQLASIDAESVAYLAVCRASRTYDASRSKITTYFSMAVRNALLKELDRNRRARYDSPLRVPMELAEALALARPNHSLRLQAAIARLPAKSRRLLHLRFWRGMSLREMGEHVRINPRTIRLRLDEALETLRSLLQNESWLP